MSGCPEGPASAPCSPVIDVRGVSKSYTRGQQTLPVLQNVSFRIEPG